MTEYAVEHVVRTTRLRDAYGDELMLTDEQSGKESARRIVMEFDLHGRSYVVLQSDDAGGSDETEVFRVTQGKDGEYGIETIADDEEWENISELVDEMTVSFSQE